MEISRNEGTVTPLARAGVAGKGGRVKQVFCTPSVAKVAGGRGAKKVVRYYDTSLGVSLVVVSVAAESLASVC
jgi:hypothetical protein